MSCAKYLGVARPAGLPSGESESPTIDDSLRATSFVSHSSSFSGNSRTQSTAGGHSVSSTIRDIAKPAKPARRSEVTARVKELCKSHGSSVLQRRHCISCGELPERRLGNANCEHRAVSTRPDSQVRRIQDGMEANSEAVDSHCDYANPWVYDGGKPLVDDFTGALSKDENKEIKRKAGRSKTELHLPLRGQSRTTSPANQRPEQWTPRKKIITSTTSAYPLSHSRGKHAQSMPSSSTCREGNSNSNTSSMFRFRPGNEHSDYVEPMDSLGPLPPKGLTWRADLPQSGAMPRSQARHSPVLNKGRSSSSAQLTGMSSALPSSAAPGMSAHKSVQKKKTLTSSISLGRSPVHPLPSLSEDEPRSAMRPRSVARNSSSISSAAQRARDQVMRQSQSSASDVPTGELGDDDIFFAQMFHSSTLDGCCAHPVSLEIQVITDGHAKVVSGAPDTPGLRRHIAMVSVGTSELCNGSCDQSISTSPVQMLQHRNLPRIRDVEMFAVFTI